jgi:hypothetical protein
MRLGCSIRCWLLALGLGELAGPAGSLAASTNSNLINFDRDIQPIFAAACLRCHGAERPKAGFRLTDRESALKGGANYADAIVPGDAAASKLLQFVAGEPADMQMPPPDQGDPLTEEQIARLRQWIAEGAAWGATAPPVFELNVSPTVRWLSVSGDENKFRELEGVNPGWAGGIEEFSLTQELDRETMLRATGRYLYDDHDGAFKLEVARREVGFVRFGLEQWRSYSDDTGGYWRPGTPAAQTLDDNLYLDQGRAWVDLGLTLPHWPQLGLGYEYQYRDGNEATLNWGLVNGRNTFPGLKHIDEGVQILKFDLRAELGGWEIEDHARVEFYDLATRRDNAIAYSTGPRADAIERVQEDVNAVQGVNTLRAEKQLYDGWRLSAGYLFSKYDGESRVNQTTLDYNALPIGGRFWSGDDLVQDRASHIWSLANLFQPFEMLSGTVGAQAEWTRQSGAGNVSFDAGDPNLPQYFLLEPAQLSSDLDRVRLSEQAGVRFTGLPWTVIYAEARLDQEQASQFEELTGTGHDAFLRDTDATLDVVDLRGGFTASPWAWLTFGGSYRDRCSDSDYDHNREVKVEADGYSAFIQARSIATREWEGRITLRPVSWLKTALTYARVDSDFRTETDEVPGGVSPGGWLGAATYAADIYGVGVTVTPWQRFFLTATFAYSDTATVSADNGNPSVVPYRGDVYSVIASARYVINERSDAFAAYGFSKSDYGQSNYAEGLPLGMEFTRQSVSLGLSRRISAACAVTVRYGYYQYDEPSSGGVNDYTAHGVFATLNYRWQ